MPTQDVLDATPSPQRHPLGLGDRPCRAQGSDSDAGQIIGSSRTDTLRHLLPVAVAALAHCDVSNLWLLRLRMWWEGAFWIIPLSGVLGGAGRGCGWISGPQA